MEFKCIWPWFLGNNSVRIWYKKHIEGFNFLPVRESVHFPSFGKDEFSHNSCAVDPRQGEERHKTNVT